MIDISLTRVVKAFEEDKNILDGLSFDINEGERVGILGKNGAGKTTMFRVLTGELDTDEGDVSVASGKRVGLISQIPRYPAGYTTEDVLRTAFVRLHDIEKHMAQLTLRMGEDPVDRAAMSEYDRLSAAFEAGGGYETETELNKVANGLDISRDMRRQSFDELSGGEKTRVNLARLILERTEILLLDEPTNHLDMRSTEWLEEYLLRFKGTVLAISHDRYFLDRVVTRIIELVKGKAEFFSGNYSFYVMEKQRRYDEQLKRYEKEQVEIKRLEESAQRLYQWGTGNSKLMKKSFAIQSRVEHIRKTGRPEHERRLGAKFASRDFRADELMVIRGLSKSYGEHKLFSDLELLVKGGERIALIGPNGAGKSTLLRIITGEEEPDEGIVRLGPSVKTAYLEQTIRFKNPQRSVLDMMVMDENMSHQAARNRLGAFKFQGEDVFRPVAMLSGGEQSRLRLCLLMSEDINLLILDEPTNHLDIASREWIEEAVEEYDGALLFVSHDRYFINRFAERIWELDGGKLTDFRGGFDAYNSYKALSAAPDRPARSGEGKKEKKANKAKPVSTERQISKLENEIARVEEELGRVEEEIELNSSDYEALGGLMARREEVQAQLDKLYLRWEQLAQELV